jgi:hypothetical protein
MDKVWSPDRLAHHVDTSTLLLRAAARAVTGQHDADPDPR